LAYLIFIIALAFQNGLERRYVDVKVLNGNDPYRPSLHLIEMS